MKPTNVLTKEDLKNLLNEEKTHPELQKVPEEWVGQAEKYKADPEMAQIAEEFLFERAKKISLATQTEISNAGAVFDDSSELPYEEKMRDKVKKTILTKREKDQDRLKIREINTIIGNILERIDALPVDDNPPKDRKPNHFEELMK